MRYLSVLLLPALLLFHSPARAVMDISREIIAPSHVVPGQPITVAVTFWTDSWFNPPPQWPDFAVQNGVLLNTSLPNQLLTRQKNGISWSGIRFERQVMTLDQSTLLLPAVDLTLTSAGQPPVTVHLDALEQPVAWPPDVEQPDRFLPARHLTLSQTITQFHAGNDKTLRAGDAIERVVTLQAEDVFPAQIPQILYAIPGDGSQWLVPENSFLKDGRGGIHSVIRVERLRYLPSDAGTLTLPPVKLRWWDTDHQQWQLATLPGQTLKVDSARAAGKESVLEGRHDGEKWQIALIVLTLILLTAAGWFARRQVRQTLVWLLRRWLRFWSPVSLPELASTNRRKK
ncbi:BatD family protein [Klebsiella aerogenes]|uniref:BatD family protein n=1 Tax=Klebsiella aerogenes TaxID=548 RepID=A0AAP9R3F2_KLEAE|nr:BatD family protein [Klebsiella aerogenes]QMR43089.1 BatD family protein [Klebsiella aerogenes]